MSSPAFAKAELAGIVLFLDSGGLVRQILRDDLGVFSSTAPGVPFASLVAEDSLEKAQNFLSEVKLGGAAFDWELNIHARSAIRCLHFAGDQARNGVWVTASTSRADLTQLYR